MGLSKQIGAGGGVPWRGWVELHRCWASDSTGLCSPGHSGPERCWWSDHFHPRPCQRWPLRLSGSPGSAGPTVPTREAWVVRQEARVWPAPVQRLLSPCPEGALSLRVGFKSTHGDQLLVGSVYFLDTKS